MGINLNGLKLKNPVITASGTFGIEYFDLVDPNKLGGITTKTITLKPREGNPQPRIIEVANGIINSIGLQNKGIDNFLKNDLPIMKKMLMRRSPKMQNNGELAPRRPAWQNEGEKTALIVSIAGQTIKEYSELVQILDKQKGIDAIELNISCPNVSKGCMIFGKDASLTKELISAVRGKTSLPLIAKLTPNTNNIVEIAKAAENAGADIISMINTVQKTIRIKGSNKFLTAGLSGPAIKRIALKLIRRVHKTVKIPIIGMGGIMNVSDAKEFFRAGVKAIEIGTANFIDPQTSIKIIDALALE